MNIKSSAITLLLLSMALISASSAFFTPLAQAAPHGRGVPLSIASTLSPKTSVVAPDASSSVASITPEMPLAPATTEGGGNVYDESDALPSGQTRALLALAFALGAAGFFILERRMLASIVRRLAPGYRGPLAGAAYSAARAESSQSGMAQQKLLVQ